MIETGVGTGAAAKSAAGAWGFALAALAFLPTLLAALAGVILALILSKDIDVDDTNLTIAYKYSTPDLSGAANNIFANILIL